MSQHEIAAEKAPLVAISSPDLSDAVLSDRALALSEKLAIPLMDGSSHGSELTLRVSHTGLSLGPSGSRRAGDIRVDFVGGRSGYRRIASGGKRQPLARAVGIHKGVRHIVDATAGLGRDSFLFAALGCRVIAMERNPVLFEMLIDARNRALSNGAEGLRNVLSRLTFMQGDSSTLLKVLDKESVPEAVYIDPMFPARKTSALSKKESRILRLLVGDDSDAEALLDIARRVATKRIVVKRHLHAKPLAAGFVAAQKATRVRYDIYLPY